MTQTKKANSEEIVDLKPSEDGKWGERYEIVKVESNRDRLDHNPPPYIPPRLRVMHEFLGGFVIGMSAIERLLDKINTVDRKIRK